MKPALERSLVEVAFNLSVDYSASESLEPLINIQKDIDEVCRKYPDHIRIQVEKVKITTNLIYRYGETGKIRLARSLYREIVALAKAHPLVNELQQAQAASAVALIAALDESNERKQ